MKKYEGRVTQTQIYHRSNFTNVKLTSPQEQDVLFLTRADWTWTGAEGSRIYYFITERTKGKLKHHQNNCKSFKWNLQHVKSVSCSGSGWLIIKNCFSAAGTQIVSPHSSWMSRDEPAAEKKHGRETVFAWMKKKGNKALFLWLIHDLNCNFMNKHELLFLLVIATVQKMSTHSTAAEVILINLGIKFHMNKLLRTSSLPHVFYRHPP